MTNRPAGQEAALKQFDEELVSGHILRSVWKLAWPIVVLQVINGSNQLIGHALVGRYVPSEENAANAAIGISWMYFLVMVVFVSSFMQGMNVLIARFSGKQDRDSIGRVVYQTCLASVGLHVFIMAPLGYFLTPALLEFAQAEPAVREYAQPYMRFLFTCSAPMFLNFLLHNAFQSAGEPKTAMVLGVLSTATNLILTVVLIMGMGPIPSIGVMGAAVGICFGGVPTMCIGFYLILSGRSVIRLPKNKSIVPEWPIIRETLRIGLPTGIQSVMLNIGGAILIRYIGEFGTSAQSAYTICYMQLFAFVTWVSFGVRGSTATLMGQNIGAGKTNRGESAVYVAAGLGLVWAGILGTFYFFFAEQLLSVFDATEEPLLTYGTSLLGFLAFSGFFVSSALAFTGGMQGAGDTISPMVIAVLSQIFILLGLCEIFSRLDVLSLNLIWASILISHASRFAMSFSAFRWGRWRRVSIRTDYKNESGEAPPADAEPEPAAK